MKKKLFSKEQARDFIKENNLFDADLIANRLVEQYKDILQENILRRARMTRFFAFLGTPIINFVNVLGEFGKFLMFNFSLIPLMFKPPFRFKEIFKEFDSNIILSFFGYFLPFSISLI